MEQHQDPNRLVGTVLGSRFEITACVAFDEAGARYDAEDSELETPASVRVLHRIRPDDASLRRLLELLTEVSNLALPGIKPLRAVGRTRTQDVYYALDLVEGQSLAQRLDHGPLRPDVTVAGLSEAGELLSGAHRVGVVHSALHPGAVIFPARVGVGAVQLLDFGLGPLIMSADVLPMGTRSAATPYQSPEQAKGDPFDARADVYALGALLFEALTGRPPFAGRSALEVLAHQLRGEAPSLAEVEPFFEGSPLQNVIDQSMQVEPDDRFVSMEAMVAALRNAGRLEATREKPVAKGTPRATAAAKASPAADKPKRPARRPTARKKTARAGKRESPLLYIVGGSLVVVTIVGFVLYQLGVFEAEVDLSSLPAQIEPRDDGADRPEEPAAAEPTTKRRGRGDRSRERDDDANDAPNPIAEAIAAQQEPLPERALTLVKQGQEALAERRYSTAISRFRSAKRAAPDAPEIARGLGLAYLQAGQTGEAARELERYLELNPNAADAQRMRNTIRRISN